MHSNGQPGVQGRADTMSVCLCVQKQSLESSGCLYTLWLKHSAQEIARTAVQLKGMEHTVAHGHMIGSPVCLLRIQICMMYLSCTLLQCKGICTNLSVLSGHSKLIVYPSRS